MSWVSDHWSTKDRPVSEKYRTNRSAFWRTTRRVVKELNIADVDTVEWPSHLVWSNLYKVSPATGGNPSDFLCDLQLSGCSDLLRLELQTYQPKRVLFLTGSNWADAFLKDIMIHKTDGFDYVSGTGIVEGARFVIVSHPQGKCETQWVNEVLEAFKS